MVSVEQKAKEEGLPSKGYDKIKLTNIYVRMFHGMGCIYYIFPLIKKNNYQLSNMNHKDDYDELTFIINRSISYFLWDILALLIEEEKEKILFIAHHLLTILGIYSGIVCLNNTYNIALGLLIGEITNPLHQMIDILKVIKYRNIYFEIFYLVSFITIRAGIGVKALVSTMYNINEFDDYKLISNGCIYSYSINISIYLLLIPLSLNWSYKQYRSIRKYLYIHL